jgi:hypothetical protein
LAENLRWHGLCDNPRGEAVVDIFRLEGGQVLEHWEVIQSIPETSANANTMFQASRWSGNGRARDVGPRARGDRGDLGG